MSDVFDGGEIGVLSDRGVGVFICDEDVKSA